MSLPDPTIKLIGWAASCAAEAIVDRVAGRVAKRVKVRAATAVKQRTAAVVQAARGRLR